jgi:hypothetical protein
MTVDAIDWRSILTNTPISEYLSGDDIINLSLASKLIRSKLVSLVFKNLILSNKVLFNESNYFMEEKVLEFGNFEYFTNIWVIGKNFFDKELAIKESRIDPFIENFKAQLRLCANHCKSISFECLGEACYFLFPMILEFQNLRRLSLNLCVISLDKFKSVLKMLDNIEILELKFVNFINSPELNSTNNIALPRNLRSITYINNKSGSSNLPDIKPIQFLTTENLIDTTPAYHLSAQYLPKLSKLNYNSTTLIEEFVELLDINTQIEDLSLPISNLSSIKTNIRLLESLKKLKFYPQSLRNNQVTAYSSDIPNFPNLEELNLNLRASTEFELAEKLIRNCPKLARLNVISDNLEYSKLRELTRFAEKLNYFNDEKL